MNQIYYTLKPLLPRSIQIFLRRQVIALKRARYNHIWPVDEKASEPPEEWTGWPEQKSFALVLTHDVDTAVGQERCYDLINLEQKMGFRSSFNFVPERYNVSTKLRNFLTTNGFEVGVHGLRHDGKLYQSKQIFQNRAAQINYYLKQWGAVGFRSPAMHHNLDWIHDLDIAYDASTFDTDPFEPQSDGVHTIFPFSVKGQTNSRGYVELPYTLPQDFTLFVLMKEKEIDIWKKKLDWIVAKGGVALLNTHPDYMNFEVRKPTIEEYPAEYYFQFLQYVQTEYKGLYWHVLPKQMAYFWSSRGSSNTRF